MQDIISCTVVTWPVIMEPPMGQENLKNDMRGKAADEICCSNDQKNVLHIIKRYL